MTEAKFEYATEGTELASSQFAKHSDDFRLQIIDDLELPALDANYIATFQNWQALRADWVEAKVRLDAVKQKLAGVEAEIRKDTDPEEYKARSADERMAKFKDIVESDVDYQEVRSRVLTCQWDKDTIETDIENAEKELSHIKTRINWRTFIVRFLGTVQPVSVQEMGL